MKYEEMQKRFGNSSDESRIAIQKAFDNDISSLEETATIWAKHHDISMSNEDTFIAFITAVDLGWRIAKAKC